MVEVKLSGTGGKARGAKSTPIRNRPQWRFLSFIAQLHRIEFMADIKIPREQFRQLSKGKPSPYCFQIRKRNQVLFYFGANHSHDPKNKQYPILRKYWEKFLAVGGSSKLVVVEGELHKLESDEAVAIQRGSEGALITTLAHRQRVRVVCPDFSKEKIVALTRKKFSEDYIQYYWFAHLIDAWYRHNPKPNFEKWMKGAMSYYSKQLGLKSFNLLRLKKVHAKIFKKPFNYRNKKFFNTVINPNELKTVINQIPRMASDVRDVMIIWRIKKEWDAGKNFFVVYGSGHAFLQEGILKKMLT